MRTLYPPLEPYAEHRLAVGGTHSVYAEECGNRDGRPVVFIHGGPGSGCQPDHRRFFDPSYYRIILFDQRGAGRSTPLGEIGQNSTQALLQDIEALRHRLGVNRWLLFGGSWGATLALLYAAAFPAAVSGLILRGLFLARQRDLEWFFSDRGVCRLFPDAWSDFTREVPAAERQDMINAYHRRIHSSDRSAATAAAQAWLAWETRVVTWTLAPRDDKSAAQDQDADRTLAKARIETHYAQHRYFIADDQILDSVPRLPQVPISIVHGQRDLTCALESAWKLHRALPASRLQVLGDTGHLMSEPAMTDALVRETDRLRESLS